MINIYKDFLLVEKFIIKKATVHVIAVKIIYSLNNGIMYSINILHKKYQ